MLRISAYVAYRIELGKVICSYNCLVLCISYTIQRAFEQQQPFHEMLYITMRFGANKVMRLQLANELRFCVVAFAKDLYYMQQSIILAFLLFLFFCVCVGRVRCHCNLGLNDHFLKWSSKNNCQRLYNIIYLIISLLTARNAPFPQCS